MNTPWGIDLELRALYVLNALFIERNATRAAERLGVTPSAVSHTLAKLRQALGDPLFVRTSRGMVPTPRAAQMEEPLRHALTELDRAVRGHVDIEPASLRRTFTVSAADYGVHTLIAPLMRKLAQESPGVQIFVQPLSSLGSIQSDLELGQLDLAIGRFDQAAGAFRRQTLFQDRFACAVRTRHPSVKRLLSLEQYLTLQHVVIAPFGRPGSIVDDELAERGLSREIVLTIPHFLAGYTIVAETDYIVTGSERLASSFQRFLPIQLVDPPLELAPFTISQMWHERMHDDPAHRWLRGMLKEVAQNAEPA